MGRDRECLAPARQAVQSCVWGSAQPRSDAASVSIAVDARLLRTRRARVLKRRSLFAHEGPVERWMPECPKAQGPPK
jgi:hypothetical protein